LLLQISGTGIKAPSITETHLNQCILSRIMPPITDPTIPASMMVRPILPASSSAPCNRC